MMIESDSKYQERAKLRLHAREARVYRETYSAPMTKMERYVFGIISCCLMIMLGIAWFLEPAKSGIGTHQQLGLPPCTFFWVTGIPCPSCGMTTSFSHVMHGNLVSALRSNWPGALTAYCCLVYVPWSIVSIHSRVFYGLNRPEQFFLSLALSILFLTFLHWCFLILRWY